MQVCMTTNTKYKPKNETEPIPWNEVRFYASLGYDCFESLYLGINTSEEDQDEIVKIARHLDPEIKIYRMKPNPTAFKLDAQPLLF